MNTKTIEMSIETSANPLSVFDALVTPSAIRQWWDADRAIVHAVPGGLWMAAWGEQEDHPDFICTWRLKVCDPPERLVFSDPVYVARAGDMPNSLGNVRVEFVIEPLDTGSRLLVTQTGIPETEESYFEGCVAGWDTTLRQLDEFLQ